MAGRTLPKLLALAVVAAAAAAPLPVQAHSPRTASQVTSPATLETGVLAELNLIRSEHGLVPLKPNASLGAAAGRHSSEMLAKSYFAHESADGSSFWQRVERFYRPGKLAFWSVGENLLWSGAALDPRKALELWMASPAHRKNILTPRWREIGISAVQGQVTAGPYAGYPVTIVTTDFGVRR